MMLLVARLRLVNSGIMQLNTYLLDEVGLHRRMSFNCPTRYIDPAGFWTY